MIQKNKVGVYDLVSRIIFSYFDCRILSAITDIMDSKLIVTDVFIWSLFGCQLYKPEYFMGIAWHRLHPFKYLPSKQKNV